MKSGMQLVLLLALGAVGATAVHDGKDRTITKVVKLLQDMLDKSKKEGDDETTIYGKFKCFCDGDEAKKKAAIKKSTMTISLLQAKIDETRGNSGELSSDTADLKAKIAENVEAQQSANALRSKASKAFVKEKEDLEVSIKQMESAIAKLADVGADQTAGAGADHAKFMAKGSLVSLNSSLSKALGAASAIMTQEQRKITASFMQDPFTGTYTSQSVQVMGTLKNLRDTFKVNLEEAITVESKALAAHTALMQLKTKAHDQMQALYNSKDKALGENDGTLSAATGQLTEAKKKMASDETLLASLQEEYATKTKGFESRELLRANEEAAIAECVSILNSDAAFETFGSASATVSGPTKALSFIQLSAAHRKSDANEVGRRHAKQALEGVQSARVSQILGMLNAGNPFKVVLTEVDKMVNLISQEGAADKTKLGWCQKERSRNEHSLRGQKEKIVGLDEQINKISSSISHVVTGLRVQIEAAQDSLTENKASQTEQTAQRLRENILYQKDVKNLVQAEHLLGNAIKVLKVYYDDLAKKIAASEAFVQKGHATPEAWKGDGAYAGQKTEGGKATSMLEFIASETNEEHMQAHADEAKSQASYEDAMAKLKAAERTAQKGLTKLTGTLATKEKDLLMAKADKKNTVAGKAATVDYLAQIKAGCDFVTLNFAKRQENRAIEVASLAKAQAAIKTTPAYTSSVLSANHDSYGACRNKCVDNDKTATCKACMTGVTVVGYCAGHPKAVGC